MRRSDACYHSLPIAYDGKVFLMSGYPESALFAVPLDAKGDITGTDKIAWSRTSDTPYCPSPVLVDGNLYFNKSNGTVLTCLDAKTGKPLIEKKAPAGYPRHLRFTRGRSGPDLFHRPRRHNAGARRRAGNESPGHQ